MTGAPERRLFFALWPSPGVRDAISAAAAPLLAEAGGRPVPPERLHLTLAFLPRVPAARVEELIGLGARLRLPPLTLRLQRPGHFARARVLWLGPARTPGALLGFRRTLVARLAPTGLLPAADVRFRAHVTLARDVRRPPAAGDVEPVDWPVTDWALVESTSGPDGPDYRVLASWPAGVPAPAKAGG